VAFVVSVENPFTGSIPNSRTNAKTNANAFFMIILLSKIKRCVAEAAPSLREIGTS
jgi:hypothetical protein